MYRLSLMLQVVHLGLQAVHEESFARLAIRWSYCDLQLT